MKLWDLERWLPRGGMWAEDASSRQLGATCSCTTLASSAYFVADTGTMQPAAQLLYMTNPESWGRVYLCVTARPLPPPRPAMHPCRAASKCLREQQPESAWEPATCVHQMSDQDAWVCADSFKNIGFRELLGCGC